MSDTNHTRSHEAIGDPTTVCPFCKRQHDTPELLELQSRLDESEKDRAEWRRQALAIEAVESVLRIERDEAMSRLGEARVLIAQARDALHPAVSPVTRSRLDQFLEGVVERQSTVDEWIASRGPFVPPLSPAELEMVRGHVEDGAPLFLRNTWS